MKHFLTQILCGTALTLASAGIAESAEKAVVVISADGTQRQELLTNVDRIEIGETSLTLKTVGGETRTTAYDELDRILIGTEYSAIQQITSPGDIAVWPTVTSDNLNVTGLQPGDAVTVYDLRGAVAVRTIATDGMTTVSVASLPSGAYIVAAGKHSVKIIKK